MNDYMGKFSNDEGFAKGIFGIHSPSTVFFDMGSYIIESPSKLAAQVIAPDIAMIKYYLDLTEMDQKLYAEFNKSGQNVTNSINASMQDVTNAINYCNINYCNQNTSQVYNFDPIKVPLPREEVNEESSIFEKILLWLEDRVNELNDLLSMILE